MKNDKAKERRSRDTLKLDGATNRLFFFIMITLLGVHVISCLYFFQAVFEPDSEISTWISENE